MINSMARDLYTESKAEQEQLVVTSGLAQCVLRPTLESTELGRSLPRLVASATA